MEPSPERVDYDGVAHGYDSRYSRGTPPGQLEALRTLVDEVQAGRILEAGCGTGHWMRALSPYAHVCGLDLSAGMLRQAHQGDGDARLIQGTACRLPIRADEFDLVMCIHALHHFECPQGFLAEVRRVLRPGGAFCAIGMDPKAGRDRWYVYEYFTSTRQMDLRRYRSGREIAQWLADLGFVAIERRPGGRIRAQYVGREVFSDPILHKGGTSQLALLSDAAFDHGMNLILRIVEAAEARGVRVVFPVDIQLHMVTGRLPAPPSWAPEACT